MPQTSYPLTMPIGFHGQLSDVRNNYCSTGINDTASPIPFGLAMELSGGGERKYRPVQTAAGAGVVMGFGVHHQDLDLLPLQGIAGATIGGTVVGVGIDVGREFTLLEEGNINLVFEQTMAQADPVYARFASGAGGTTLGAIRKDADTATAQLLKGAAVVVGAAAGQVGTISFSKLANH